MGDRAVRFAESVRMELAELLPTVKAPRVSDAGLLTITHVRVSDDLSVARVQIAVHGADAEKQKGVIKGLTSASGWLKREIGRRLRAKKVPELRFHVDETDDKADRVEQLLREIAAERPEKP